MCQLPNQELSNSEIFQRIICTVRGDMFQKIMLYDKFLNVGLYTFLIYKGCWHFLNFPKSIPTREKDTYYK